MAFLSPIFLWGALAAAIPIALHLFHRRTEPVIRFAALRYLRHAPVEQSRRRRLKELALLALRVAALVLLAIAFARPFLAGAASAGAPITVVLLDTSASMTAPGQFERAKQAAADAIRSAPATDAVAVVTFAQGADVLSDASAGRQAAQAAVSRLRPGAGGTSYRAALARAADLIGERPGRIIVITDLQQVGWDAADQGGVPQRITLDLRDVGAPKNNLAVRALRVDEGDAVATVQNFSSAEANVAVSFAIDGRPLASATVPVPARGTGDARVTLGRVSGVLSATVADRDGYAADNVRYAVLDADSAPSVLAVTTTGHSSEVFYVDRALSVSEGAAGFRFRAMSGPAFASLAPGGLKDVDVVAILGTRGLDAHAGEMLAGFVRAGGGLLVTAGPDVDPAQLDTVLQPAVRTTFTARDAAPRAEPGADLRFAPADTRHPVFRLFDGVGALGNVAFTHAALMTASPGAETVARYSDGTAAVVEEHVGSGRVLLFASDLNHRWNDFPLQPAFVPFLHETLRYLAPGRSVRHDYLVGELPGDSGATPGVVDLNQRPGTPRRVAVNVDPRESDPARISEQAFRGAFAQLAGVAARQSALERRGLADGQRWWQAALMLMVVALAAEGVLGRRLG